MTPRCSATGPAVCAAAAIVVLSGAPAQAREAADIAGTPHDRLIDGQVVQVDWTGWPDPSYDFQSWGLLQCPGTTADLSRCGNAQVIPESSIPSAGSWSVDYAVRRSFRSYDGSAAIECGAGCNVVALMIVNVGDHVQAITASAPITFANAK
jgi:hypothetical protein